MNALDAIANALEPRLPGCVRRNAPSTSLTTYRCGGPLAVLVEVEQADSLSVVADALAEYGKVPVLVIGRGSNLLISDAGFAGIALVLRGDFEALTIDHDTARIDAGGGVALPVLARRSAAAGVGGLEFYVGIPGSVGGAVRMNAGGHGAETFDVVTSARIFDLGSGTEREVACNDLDLGYRRSGLRSGDVVVAATFSGHADDPPACEARIDAIVRWRREHQPGGQNAGSVFTNPPGDSAGRLVDSCGLKGLRSGRVVVSHKHANFFVAEPGARADDVIALIHEVQRRVETTTRVRLEPEVHLVGFGDRVEEAGR